MLDAYEREGATVVFNVPQQWDLLCAQPDIDKRDLKLRIISWGAAPASDSTLRAMAEKFPGALNVAVFGQTETSPITCVLSGEDSLRKLGSVGKPIPTLQYRIVDDAMNDVAVGEVGEIVYRGPTVTQGYWKKPQETAEAFAGGWFHSGDLVKQDEEGFVWVVDRRKDMIISGGENIYCAEVENAIAAHPAVREVAVLGRADERWGQVPVAFVSLAPDAALSLPELTGFLDGRLASFKRPRISWSSPNCPATRAGRWSRTRCAPWTALSPRRQQHRLECQACPLVGDRPVELVQRVGRHQAVEGQAAILVSPDQLGDEHRRLGVAFDAPAHLDPAQHQGSHVQGRLRGAEPDEDQHTSRGEQLERASDRLGTPGGVERVGHRRYRLVQGGDGLRAERGGEVPTRRDGFGHDDLDAFGQGGQHRGRAHPTAADHQQSVARPGTQDVENRARTGQEPAPQWCGDLR